ncbi:MAG TPA: glycosyltransferase family 39 protein [Anaerolineales bacterium]|nr:glycosyltransferase family 39 protein [Anaerolineales bacterium]
MSRQIKQAIIVLLLLWSGFVIATYFVAHKPFVIQVFGPITDSLWSLIITSVLFLNGIGIGELTIKRIMPTVKEDETFLLLAGGIGLGELGLIGFGLAVSGITNFFVLLGIQLALFAFFWQTGRVEEILQQCRRLTSQIKNSGGQIPPWMKWASALTVILIFLRTFLPPIDAFDALLYHLRIPELWLRDEGLQAYNIPHYWFPALVEGVYFLGLGLRSEIVSQQIHFLWGLLLALLLWSWTRRVWDNLTAWWTWMFLVSMPSLLLLASWAYTDLALSYFGIAMLFTLWLGNETQDTRWWLISGIAAGMAMGIKYTSFVMPLTAVIVITIWKFRAPREWWRELIRFSLISIATAVIWYLRNWLWMNNPFYPFVFGGKYWDAFRAAAFSGAGTGIGWDLKALLALPLTVTLGYQDINYFDGNIGPLYLLALPLALFVFGRINSLAPSQSKALMPIGVFVLLSASFWTFGYITSRSLWQTRLLIPAILPSAIPMAIGILSLQALDAKRFRLSFIISGLVAVSIFLNLLDATLSVIARNPLAIAVGIVSREEYFSKYQSGYFSALQMISQTPPNAKIYSLLEPRSYGSSREIQPDPILDNFAHDVYLYKDPPSILQAWREEGYTHILLNLRGANLIYENKDEQKILDETLNLLDLIALSPNGEYALYEIPGH